MIFECKWVSDVWRFDTNLLLAVLYSDGLVQLLPNAILKEVPVDSVIISLELCFLEYKAHPAIRRHTDVKVRLKRDIKALRPNLSVLPVYARNSVNPNVYIASPVELFLTHERALTKVSVEDARVQAKQAD